MRPECKTKVIVRNTVIGGANVAVCLPLAAEHRTELLEQAHQAVPARPDLLEWRVDSFIGVEHTAETLDTLEAMRKTIGDIPLIFTCRIRKEGGARSLTREHRLDLICAAISSGHVDMVDIELCNDQAFIEAVKSRCRETGTPLMLSYHDFNETPKEDVICDTLIQARNLGADIAKLAVMPNDYGDVLTLMQATHRVRAQGMEIPVVTMAMGAEGIVSRIAGGLFGSDMTFAMGRNATAPGQIPIDRLRQAMDVVYNP